MDTSRESFATTALLSRLSVWVGRFSSASDNSIRLPFDYAPFKNLRVSDRVYDRAFA